MRKKEIVIVAVSSWTDEEGVEHPGFAHAYVIKDAKAETIEGILKRITIPYNEIELLIKKSGQMDGVTTRLLQKTWNRSLSFCSLRQKRHNETSLLDSLNYC